MSAAIDLESIGDGARIEKPSWNPLRCTGTGLPINLTVMVKVLAVVLLLTDHVRLMPDPWLPFIPWIALIPPSLFQWALRIVFVASALAIVFNRRTQVASFMLGATMLLAIVSSKSYYGNNKTFCGLMLLLAGLYKAGGPPFIRWQLAVTYFGAGLNKLIDHDWHTGVFFEYWAAARLHEHVYLWLDAHLPRLWLGKFFCWFTIVAELGVVPFLLAPSVAWFYWGALANILFQCGLLLFVGNTFTLFWYAMNAASFAFAVWPKQPMTVSYSARFSGSVRRFLQWIDVDRRYAWRPSTGALQLFVDQKTYTGARALRMIVLYNPLTYLFIGGAMAVADGSGLGRVIFRRVFVAGLLILLMPPLAWCIDKCFGNGVSHEVQEDVA